MKSAVLLTLALAYIAGLLSHRRWGIWAGLGASVAVIVVAFLIGFVWLIAKSGVGWMAT